MDTAALRQKILDLAIRGKLVPQEPTDEPASVLLERIRAQKQKMVKEGKLKAKEIKNDTIIFKGADNLHYEKFQDGTVKCIEDEIPFDVPEGWEWSRLGSISINVMYGLSNSAQPSGTHKLLRITDIQDGKVDWDNVPYTTIKDRDDYLLKNNDIVFARTGATVGKSFLISDAPKNSVYASYLIRIRMSDILNTEYIYHFFNSGYYWFQITDKSVGVGQPNCNGTSLKELLVPISPLMQQNSIVLKIADLAQFVDVIESKKRSLIDAASLTKAKILDLAIRGKLVPQNPNDESASVFLERIRAEKEELIKQGKIKREKNESIIFKGDDNSYYEKFSDGTEKCIDDEIPFDLPENWLWSRLSAFCPYGDCEKIDTKNISDDEWILDLEDIEKATGKILQYALKGTRNSISTKHRFSKGQLLYSKLRPYLNKVVIAPDDGYCTSEILPLQLFGNISPQYMQIYLMSDTFLSYVDLLSYGVKMPRLGTADGKKALIALPPINEQQRISESVKLAFIQVEQIINILS